MINREHDDMVDALRYALLFRGPTIRARRIPRWQTAIPTVLEWLLYLIIVGVLVYGIWSNRTPPTTRAPEPPPAPAIWDRKPQVLHLCSWYAKGLKDPEAMQVASNIHPRGKRLELRIRPSDPWLLVVVRDFGPDPKIHPDRTLDVSLGVARKLGMVRTGLAFVEVREVQ